MHSKDVWHMGNVLIDEHFTCQYHVWTHVWHMDKCVDRWTFYTLIWCVENMFDTWMNVLIDEHFTHQYHALKTCLTHG
jgi:hypothetical protein